jgi:hypothetical protein
VGQRRVVAIAVSSLRRLWMMRESADRDSSIDLVAGSLGVICMLCFCGGAKAGVAPGLNILV